MSAPKQLPELRGSVTIEDCFLKMISRIPIKRPASDIAYDEALYTEGALAAFRMIDKINNASAGNNELLNLYYERLQRHAHTRVEELMQGQIMELARILKEHGNDDN